MAAVTASQVGAYFAPVSKTRCRGSFTEHIPAQMQANTPRFAAYTRGTLPSQARPDLAGRIEDNLTLLRVLCQEMRGPVSSVDAVQASMQQEMSTEAERSSGDAGAADCPDIDGAAVGPGDEAAVGVQWSSIAETTVLAAALLDGLQRDLDLMVSR